MRKQKIIAITPLQDYRVHLLYETGENKIFDVSPYIHGGWYGMLKDISYFKAVRISSDGTGIEWADGQDIAPHELYEASMTVRA